MQFYCEDLAHGRHLDRHEIAVMENITHAKAVFLAGFVDSAFSGDRPTSISRSLYLAARRSSLLLAKAHEQLNKWTSSDQSLNSLLAIAAMQ